MKTDTMPSQIGVRIPPADIEHLRRVAASEGRSVSGQIRYWVLRGLRAQREQERPERAR